MQDNILESQPIDRLALLIEEGARASERSVKRFIEPASGTLRRALSKRHHIIFGRRGSGKTSLLKKAYADFAIERKPIAYVDLEPYKGHHYPDVLISILIATFSSFIDWLDSTAIYPASKKTFWDKIFGKRPSASPLNIKGAKELKNKIKVSVDELIKQLHLSDGVEIENCATTNQEQANRVEGNLKIGKAGIDASCGVESQQKNIASEISTEKYKRSKIDFLYKNIIEYQTIFKELYVLSGNDSYLFLDDLYHIRKKDQTELLDYFHRIVKGNNAWLKVGTIRHRSQWYIHGNPPLGLKLGDDADEINLDLTLEKYSLAKKFLIMILNGLIDESSAPKLNDFVTDGAIDRLILASGGVARDFLGIFRKAIDEARERISLNPRHSRGLRIGSEDVNLSAGLYGETKKEEFKLDTLEDRIRLEKAFSRISNFCIDEINANCFLLDQDLTGKNVELIHELVDLRLIHHVRSRVTVSGRRGRIYQAYMLDVSQYTGARKRRELEMVDFWETGTQERLRRASLIFDPTNENEFS